MDRTDNPRPERTLTLSPADWVCGVKPRKDDPFVLFKAPLDPHRVVKRFEIPNVGPRPEGSGEPLVLEFIDGGDSRPRFAAQARGEYRTPRWLLDLPRTISAARNRSIDVIINSLGIGNVRVVQPIFDALLSHPWTVRVTITNTAASGAALVALAGDRRTMPYDGDVMIHPAFAVFSPRAFEAMQQDPDEKRRVIERLRGLDDQSAAIVAARTSLSLEEARAEIEKDDILLADEALARGIVHEIIY